MAERESNLINDLKKYYHFIFLSKTGNNSLKQVFSITALIRKWSNVLKNMGKINYKQQAKKLYSSIYYTEVIKRTTKNIKVRLLLHSDMK